MVDVKIVDASALAAVLFAEPEGLMLGERLSKATLAAPTLLPYEFANVCITKIRRRPANRDQYLAAFGIFLNLDIETFDVEFSGVAALAEETNLTAYDASYLWLARRLDAELVTLDLQLAAAAGP